MSWLRRPRAARVLPDFLQVPWSGRDVVLLIVAWFGLQVAALLALRAVAPALPLAARFVTALQAGNVDASFTLNLLDAGIGFGLVSLYLQRYQAGWSLVGWRRVSLARAVGYVAGVLIVFMVASSALLALLSVLVPGFDAQQAQSNEFIGAAKTHHSLALVALVLLPPVLEETIFRGFIFPAIARRRGVVWGAVLSSALFGLAHWQANIVVYTFVLGLLLCFMYVRLRSIVPGIFLHMLNNYLAFLALSSGK